MIWQFLKVGTGARCKLFTRRILMRFAISSI
jgi:hypothetical protein